MYFVLSALIERSNGSKGIKKNQINRKGIFHLFDNFHVPLTKKLMRTKNWKNSAVLTSKDNCPDFISTRGLVKFRHAANNKTLKYWNHLIHLVAQYFKTDHETISVLLKNKTWKKQTLKIKRRIYYTSHKKQIKTK